MNGMVAPLAVLGIAFLLQRSWARGRIRQEAEAAAEAAAFSGPDAPIPQTQYPKIDASRCIGCGACARACPEDGVLGVVAGRSRLLNPLACVGHATCVAACPVGAVQLVLGAPGRAVEVPRLDRGLQSNLPGVYVVGELGGRGLIRNAVAEGVRAAGHVVASGRRAGPGGLDAVVVGAGPAGIAAALTLVEAGLTVELLERESYGGTVAAYPRGKIVTVGALELPGRGVVDAATMTKEELMALLEELRVEAGLVVHTGVIASHVEPAQDGRWRLQTAGGPVDAANVLLALGRRGIPRKLGVPGEELAKVRYRLADPADHRGEHVLVVGGGVSAAETALALAEQGACASVSISYRRAEFSRLGRRLRASLSGSIAEGRIRAFLPSEVVQVRPDRVVLRTDEENCALWNDTVIVQAGGTIPTELLGRSGIELVARYGDA